jgi:hypothetical protein
MKHYRDSGAHRVAMPKMLNWADEGAMARYQQPDAAAPAGAAALSRLAEGGRTSKVRYPTPEHAAGGTVPDGKQPFVARVLSPTTPRE